MPLSYYGDNKLAEVKTIPLEDINIYEHSSYVATGNKPQYKLDVQADKLTFSATATKLMLYVLNAGWDHNFIDDIKVSEGWEITDKAKALLRIQPNYMTAIEVVSVSGSTAKRGILTIESKRSSGKHIVELVNT